MNYVYKGLRRGELVSGLVNRKVEQIMIRKLVPSLIFISEASSVSLGECFASAHSYGSLKTIETV